MLSQYHMDNYDKIFNNLTSTFKDQNWCIVNTTSVVTLHIKTPSHFVPKTEHSKMHIIIM